MGKRRIRNLLANKIPPKDIYCFDLSEERRLEVEKLYSVKTFSEFRTAVETVQPDAYIISTPPNLHAFYFLHAAKLNKHFFVEVATTSEGYSKLLKLMMKRT